MCSWRLLVPFDVAGMPRGRAGEITKGSAGRGVLECIYKTNYDYRGNKKLVWAKMRHFFLTLCNFPAMARNGFDSLRFSGTPPSGRTLLWCMAPTEEAA
ncbi:hypothetical protein KL86DPRO_30011 [uncultured delta proteobacterium]|uniref:Uncharacterized protein n=1 Tax=uncultured delta proteobacterium TaxID=34034 RepID=A0A212K677_9DELT|nr:hypothetical protein KL86DPRO_30011 [uncultured delta proteobacterium]